MLCNFLIPGKASFILGGQYGSCGKGAAAAFVAYQLQLHGESENETHFSIVTTNAGCQSGHTSVHDGVKNVVFHLPTAPLIVPGSIGYLNAGAVIDPVVLNQEIEAHHASFDRFYIHPNAAVITQDCRDDEGRADSAQTRIASTRKGVGAALARKALRSGARVKESYLVPERLFPRFSVGSIDLNRLMLHDNKSVLIEVPQGFSLSLNGPFYPHCTSRDCTVAQAASDAGIHPSLVGPVMLVLRTFPIRVGNITLYDKAGFDPKEHTIGHSGDCYPDQREISWSDLGVEPEITTVTKRVRRVFTWSHQQTIDAMASARPTHVFLSHVDYLDTTRPGRERDGLQSYVMSIQSAARAVGLPLPQIMYSTGPSTADVHFWESRT